MSDNQKINWQQACKILGCGKTKFYDLVSSGQLPAEKVGERGIRVRKSDVEKLIQPVSDCVPFWT